METQASSRKRRSSLRSAVWEHFVPALSRQTAKCKLCDAIVKTTGGTTSGLGRHLATYHSESDRSENDGTLKTLGFLNEQGALRRPQTVVPIDKTGPQPQRMLVSPAWEFFDPLVFKETAKCKICDDVLKTTGGTTTGLSRHLASRHGGNLKALRNEISLKNQRQNSSHATTPKMEIRSDDELQEDGEPVRDEQGKHVVVAQIQVPLAGETHRANCTFKRKRRRTSNVWKYFSRDDKKGTASCTLCDVAFAFKSNFGTTSLVRHLRSQHSREWSVFRRKTRGMNFKPRKRGHQDSDEEVQTVDTLDCYQNYDDNSKDEEGKGRLPDVENATVDDCLPGKTPLLDRKLEQVGVTEKRLLAKTDIMKHSINHPRRLRSTVWKYFTTDLKKGKAKCNICGDEYKYKLGDGTSGLGRHLETQHNQNLQLLRSKMWGLQFEPRSRGTGDITTLKRKSPNVNTDSESDEVQEDIFEDDGSPVKEKETANQESGTVSKRTSNRITTTRRSKRSNHCVAESCFVCRTDITEEPVTQFSQREYRFLFMEILEIPAGKTMSYLDELELPDKWVALCKSCQSSVEESVTARRKIISLQLQIEKSQIQILEKIKTSSITSPLVYPIKQRQVLDAIRNFVHSKNYSVLEDSHSHHVNIDANDNYRADVDPDPESDFSPASECDDDGPEEPIQNKVIQSQSLFCGLCDDDKVYESEALLAAHTKEAHSQALAGSPSITSSSSISNKDYDDLPQEQENSRSEKPVIFCRKPVSCNSYNYRYSCPNCPQIKGYTVTQFALHLGIHQRRPYQCSVCSALLPAEKDTQEAHWNENHSNLESTLDSDKFVQIKFSPGQLWKCESCLAKFYSEEDRDQHELTCLTSAMLMKRNSLVETKRKPYNCNICEDELRFRNFVEWRFHRTLCHAEVDSMSCYYCSESFCEITVDGVEARDDQKLLDHIHTKHGTMKILTECEPCGLVFEPGMGKTKHMTERHGVPGSKVFPCSLCDISYPDFRGVRRHMSNTHFQRSSYICHKCGENFREVTSLLHHNFKFHGIVPEGQEVLSCPQKGCSFKSISKGKFNLHKARVHQSPDFVCKFCGKVFKNREYIKQHEDIHRNMNTKPFQCEQCGVSFAIKYYLNVHRKRQHEGRRNIRQRNRGMSKGGVST